ncbi:threonine ammonia-lyase [Aurantiacibacter sp. D1-12]|uniref:threonine ammonia-lyase n=1 Tax=Aurantiacibacter sp. D1-12 TaxID=2993658 RepID=UPI00237D0375|nr:threonine ammonia-lyase [Aurantiacibacter sp. D1-12]MDE1466991.1 threonine ammonia-lyase [Aurantiacibacter sp. D1-12]
MSEGNLTFADIEAAAARIDGAVVRTPTLHSKTLSSITGAEVWLKFENQQFTAAYKERGALNALLHLTEEQRQRGVIAASAGNHSQGLSHHGTRLGVPVTIVMPRTTPVVKVMQTEAVGGNVVLEGETFDEAYAHARELEKERDLTFVHPFDHPHVIAGQGTVGIEMLQDVPDLDMIVVPVGGGGLISGVALAAKAMKPDIKIIGVQSSVYPAMYGLKIGKPRVGGGATIAEGIAVKEPGQLTRSMVMSIVDEMRIISEAKIEEAISLLLDIEKTVVEGAGATGLATLLPPANGKPREEFAGKKVGVILTGGNIDQRFLANVIMRTLARTGRIGLVSLILTDRVGALSDAAEIFTRNGANILEISQQRIFGVVSAKSIKTDIEFEIRDQNSFDALIEDLREQDYAFETMTLSGLQPGRSGKGV